MRCLCEEGYGIQPLLLPPPLIPIEIDMSKTERMRKWKRKQRVRYTLVIVISTDESRF